MRLKNEFKGLESKIMNSGFPDDRELINEISRSVIEDTIIILAKDNRKDLGALTADICQKEDKNVLLVTEFYIKKNYRGKGLAKYLFNKLERYAKENGYEEVILAPKIEKFGSVDKMILGRDYISKRGYKPLIYKKEVTFSKKILITNN